jgi:haloalkane dehalogenase
MKTKRLFPNKDPQMALPSQTPGSIGPNIQKGDESVEDSGRALRSDLPDYPFVPRYHVLPDGARMHYVDEGHSGATAVLLLHREPTWSYLYRKMIPPIVKAGLRVLAPDLIGFGKSDKLTRVSEYTYQGHLEWLLHWIEALEQELTLFCQDWGSFLGLRLAMEYEQRFCRIMVSNGFLPTVSNGFSPTARKLAGTALLLWRAFARWSPWFPTGRIVRSGCVVKLRPEEIAAYDAPFPSEEYKAAARAFPQLVPFDANPAKRTTLSNVIAPSSALITGSLARTVIGDRPSHPI